MNNGKITRTTKTNLQFSHITHSRFHTYDFIIHFTLCILYFDSFGFGFGFGLLYILNYMMIYMYNIWKHCLLFVCLFVHSIILLYCIVCTFYTLYLVLSCLVSSVAYLFCTLYSVCYRTKELSLFCVIPICFTQFGIWRNNNNNNNNNFVLL